MATSLPGLHVPSACGQIVSPCGLLRRLSQGLPSEVGKHREEAPPCLIAWIIWTLPSQNVLPLSRTLSLFHWWKSTGMPNTEECLPNNLVDAFPSVSHRKSWLVSLTAVWRPLWSRIKTQAQVQSQVKLRLATSVTQAQAMCSREWVLCAKSHPQAQAKCSMEWVLCAKSHPQV